MSPERVIGLLVVLVLSLSRLPAAFVGDYDESRWTFKAYGGDGVMDWMGDDACFLDSGFTGDGTLAQADLVVRASRSGTFHFNWAFYGGTGTGYRLVRLRNDSGIALANRKDYAEGTHSFTATAGDLIGFRVSAPLDEFPAMAEISGFFAPGQEPGILVQPRGASACLGANAIFSVVATNALDYQWQFKGQNLPEENFEDLILPAIPPADTGTYRVIVRNPLGTITSQAVPMTVQYPPVITSQPTPALTRCAGQALTMSVSATGTSLQYQWRLNGVALNGATGASLTLPVLTGAHSGEYRATVYNGCGAILSGPLLLNVATPPVIQLQPSSQSRYVGEGVTFAPVLAGSGPMQCQWRRDGVNLPGATDPTLILSRVQPSDAGTYSVLVSNSCGVATSAGAALTIAGGPVGIRIVPGTGREVTIEVQGIIGRQYALEVSSDASHWTAIQTNWLVISGSPLFYERTDRDLRFYRVRPAE